MSSTSKVSILLCVYNAEEYLEECLQSIKDQTYKNIQVVVINDGSIDNSLRIINQFFENHSYIDNIVIDQDNIGLTKSLNKAIDFSSGEYIARLDADDKMHPQRVELSLSYLENNSLDFLTTAALIYNDNFNASNLYKKVPSVNVCKKYYFTLDLLKLGNLHVHGTFFGKADIFKKLKYNEKYRKAQDFDFLIRLASEKDIKKGYLDTPLYFLRKIGHSSGRSDSKTQILNCRKALQDIGLSSRYLIPGSRPIKKLLLRTYKFLMFSR